MSIRISGIPRNLPINNRSWFLGSTRRPSLPRMWPKNSNSGWAKVHLLIFA